MNWQHLYIVIRLDKQELEIQARWRVGSFVARCISAAHPGGGHAPPPPRRQVAREKPSWGFFIGIL